MTIYTGLALTLLVGILIGLLVARLSVKKSLYKATKVDDLELQLGEKELEMAEFKEQVSDHFVETADLINNLTQSYKAVYDHLEKGAFSLVGAENLQKRLSDVKAESVRLEYIGLKRPEASREALYVVELPESVTETPTLLSSLSEALHISNDQAKNLLKRAPGVITKAISLKKAEQVEVILKAQDIKVNLNAVEL